MSAQHLERERSPEASVPLRPAREERGAVLPIAVSILLIVLLLTGAAVAYSVRSVDRSNYDRYAARALAAADAGLDVARYRMNKTLVGGQTAGVIGLVGNVTRQLGCTQIGLGAGGLLRVGLQQGAGWCAAGGWELVDGDGGVMGEHGDVCASQTGSAFRYFMRLDVGADVLIDRDGVINNDPVAWDVISAGCANGRTAVVRGQMEISLQRATGSGSLLQLFELKSYEQCGGLTFDPAFPDATCS